MARQRSKRPREDDPSPPRPQQDGQQENPRAKRAKTGHDPRQQHHEVQTSPPSPPRPQQDSQQENPRAKRAKRGHNPRQQHHEVQTSPSPPRPQQDSRQKNPRAKRAKTGHDPRQQHPEVKTSPSPPRPQQNSRIKKPRAKRAKTGPDPRQQHHEVQTYPPSPPSLPQDNHVGLLSTKEEEHSPIAVAGQPNPDLERKTDDHQTITPAPPGTDSRLTRENLAKLNRMSSNLPSHVTFQASGEGSGHTNPTDPKTSVSAPALASVAAPGPTEDSFGTTESDKGSVYINAFPFILEDSGIYIDGDPSMLADREELRRERSVRPSLAPSKCSDGEIERIFKANAHAVSKRDVSCNILLAIEGRFGFGSSNWDRDLPHSSGLPFGNMSSMTGNRTVAPRPDLFYGAARLEDIAKPLRDSIGHLIVPSILPHAPAAPHFVVELAGLSGRLDVMKCQAAYSAAATARAVFALENFGVDDPKYDDTAKAHAWTYSSASGLLTHYAMRVGRPEPGSLDPSYHFTQVETYFIMHSINEFRKGVSAFRHCRDESHAKNEARLAEAHERLRRRSQQTSQQTSHPVPGSTLPACPPESHPEMNPPENDASLLEQQLQQDREASFSEEAPGPGSSSAAVVITTNMTSAASTHVTKASRHDGTRASSKQISVSKSRPQRTRRRPKRFGMLDS